VKGSDKAIVLGVVMAVVLAVFYFKVLGPKRDEAKSLKQDITQLNTQIDQQKQTAAYAEDARRHFPVYYSRIVAMGKAAPSQADTASLLVQLNTISHSNHVIFDGLQLSAQGGDTATAASSTSTGAAPTDSTASGTSPSSTSTTGTSTTATSTTPTATTPASTSTAGATTAAPATEADAASLPIGAAVGPAGLPVMPYKLKFSGTYFDAADFLRGVDGLVHPSQTTGVSAEGRLLTVDGFLFKLQEGATGPNPPLEVDLAVTSYVTPSGQGLTAGAAPAGPAPATSVPEAQPASAVTP
jgi:Tfp pilus assembly protein PilO